MLEPIQGEGGVVIPQRDYLAQVRKLCDETGCLLIFDEVQTGVGRTGRLFAYEHFDVAPDILTLAKALGNGLPIGAMLATEKAASAFVPGTHASTFGGTPLVTSVALKVLKLLTEEGILDEVEAKGAYLRNGLETIRSKHAIIQDVRGMGLLVGARLNQPGAPIVKACMERGFLVNCVQDDILRFAPPLIIGKEEIDGVLDCLDRVFSMD